MKKLKLGVSVFLSALLAGCLSPSVPEAKDVTAQLNDLWSGCKLIQPADITKVNGIDRGDHYVMQITYKLAFTKDASAEEVWGGDGASRDVQTKFWNSNCTDEALQRYFAQIIEIPNNHHHIQKPAVKGEGPMIETEFKMAKSEKGWISIN